MGATGVVVVALWSVGKAGVEAEKEGSDEAFEGTLPICCGGGEAIYQRATDKAVCVARMEGWSGEKRREVGGQPFLKSNG